VPIAKEGWPIVAAPIMAAGAAVAFGRPFFAAAFVVAALALGLFFRDPKRLTPHSPTAVFCPADGKVLSIDEVDDADPLNEKSRRISVFMSLFDVHMNYAPISGRVEYIKYRKGAFHRANLPDASRSNENNSIGIRQAHHRVMLRQIAGKVARRIVCRVEVNDQVQAGQRIGLIKFGSRVELFIPLEWEVLVKKGDRVKGGVSEVGRFH